MFAPSMKNILLHLLLHVMLALDSAPAHPPNLRDDRLEDFKFIQFLPPNTLLPQGTQGTSLPHKEFWNYHFYVFGCLNVIENAWKEVNKRALD
ncbi:DDE-1 domain-containing protein [Nephila pilipes]|uniref:DDE-1 domain-containing protein n=1 Tax=Nephila pilipes TaxID=299642 RepID=A0A8X6QTU1_NEPPI|nr:DDE-1 domain-containing protein [Nephila pilipes]